MSNKKLIEIFESIEFEMCLKIDEKFVPISDYNGHNTFEINEDGTVSTLATGSDMFEEDFEGDVFLCVDNNPIKVGSCYDEDKNPISNKPLSVDINWKYSDFYSSKCIVCEITSIELEGVDYESIDDYICADFIELL